jgi:hypothetical protein
MLSVIVPCVCLVFSIWFEQLPENGLVRPKYVAIKCDFNDISK